MTAGEYASLLRGALLWLRNHYEVGAGIPEPDKQAILKAVDQVLGKVSDTDLQRFRRWAKAQQVL